MWWTVSVVAMAVAWGSLANSIEEFTKDNQSLQDVLARSGSASVTDGYLSTTLLFSALIAGGAALQIVTRLRTEETEHRGDTVLATPGHAVRLGRAATSRRRSPAAGSPSWPVGWGSGRPTGS